MVRIHEVLVRVSKNLQWCVHVSLCREESGSEMEGHPVG